jgi:hypothetical protein
MLQHQSAHSLQRFIPSVAIAVLTSAIALYRQRQTDARLAIEDANERFYAAFRSGNIKVRACTTVLPSGSVGSYTW